MKITTFLIPALLCIHMFGCQPSQDPNQTKFSIDYEKFELSNGLEVILHEDHSDPIVAVATLVHVGSNREKPGRTGFAHFFEHMSFNDSENVPRGANRKMIPEWGGTRNGGTWSDGTIYYEVVPKDAFEKILWIDSDRLGFMINTVTEDALEREKQVVKNEKRERVDNSPYGFTNEIIRKNMYPASHPYSWTVIGELEDLQAATIDDVKEFYDKYYGAANATLVIAGDIDPVETKKLVEQWFGEIRKGPEVASLAPMPVTLNSTKAIYYEDNFAKLPQLTVVFPTVEQYHPDSYALQVLGNLLGGSKKAPLYKEIVETKKYSPNVSSYQSSSELAGEFNIRVRSNDGVDLDSVKLAIEDALQNFESDGFSENELVRIKAELETSLYRGIETVLNKAFTLVQDNEFAGDPAHIIKSAEMTNAVTKEDVMRVYEKYIMDKYYVMVSVVPKGQTSLSVDGSVKADLYEEEVVAGVNNEEVGQGSEADYEKTETAFDRSEPEFGELPLFKMPEIWIAQLEKTSIPVYGIVSEEIPLVSFDISIDGGHMLDELDNPGVASLMSDLMMEGTVDKSPEELEEAIGLLGASINVRCNNEEILISGSCLSRNFKATIALVEEILLKPRWDEKEFSRLKLALETRLKGNEARPRAIAYVNFMKLLYGNEHIFGTSVNGTRESAEKVTLEDLKSFYAKNISASEASVHVAGLIYKDDVLKAFNGIDQHWKAQEIEKPNYRIPEQVSGGNVYFIDVPNSKQSVIYAGKLALSALSDDHNNLVFANEVLGGGPSGMLFQTLRIEKGYTYGYYSRIMKNKEVSPFITNGSVRANATNASLEIIIDMVGSYGDKFDEKDMEITKNKVLKRNTMATESLNTKLNILRNISKYNSSMKYLEDSQDELINMNLEDFKAAIDKYIVEEDMIYVVVGDKATQLSEVNKLGKGNAIELDIYGNPI